MKCIGFGEHETKCNNLAGTKWSKHWCERCDKLRLDHIENQLKKLSSRKFSPCGEIIKEEYGL